MELVSLEKCPVCKNKLGQNSLSSEDYNNLYHIKCSFCGDFQIFGHQLLNYFGFHDDSTECKPSADPLLCISIRHLFTVTGKEVILTRQNIDEIRDTKNIPQYPLEQVDVLLKYLHNKFNSIASDIFIPISDYPLLFLKNEQELHKLLEFAHTIDYAGNIRIVSDGIVCRIKFKGWERIKELTYGKVQSYKAFVAMKFGDAALDEMYELAIKSAVIEAGFVPYRIDKQEHNDKICDKIIAEIKQSGFLIADFTCHRGGVYFEAGFALGLGKPIIWCCRKDDVDNLHFDTRQYNHIIWKNAEDLKSQLLNRIKATIPTRNVIM